MTVLQISLLIVGVILLFASFFVTERLTKKEVDELSRLSSAQLQKVVDKEISTIEDKVTDLVGEAVDKAAEELQRPMEKLSNEKIMAINEYSDTVMDDINKSHSEILFLYNMMNDKQDELRDMLSSIERNKKQLREMSDNVVVMEKKTAAVAAAREEKRAAGHEAEPSYEQAAYHSGRSSEAELDEMLRRKIEADELERAQAASQSLTPLEPDRVDPGFVFRERDDDESEPEIPEIPVGEVSSKALLRRQIIEMYDDGMSVVDIGRKLKCGVGEVKLVIDLVNKERNPGGRGGKLEA